MKEGIPFTKLVKAAVINDGIIQVDEAGQKDLVSYFESNANDKTVLKFVPASGAASRMFKAMFGFLEKYDPKQQTLSEYIEQKK